MQKAIKDLAIGDLVRIVEPEGVGRITAKRSWSLVEGADMIVEWRRTDNQEPGHYLGSSEDIVETA